MSSRILIVDDDPSMAETLSKAMSRRGFGVIWKTSAADALKLLGEQDFDAVVTDLHMEGMDGFAFCGRIVANRPDVPVVIITAFGSTDSAVAATRVGAYAFITKPFDVEVLRLTLARAVQHRSLQDEVRRLRQTVSEGRGFERVLGSSPPIQDMKDLIDRVSDAEGTLLIAGERGTRKELVALTVHQRSRRSTGPFVALSCASISETILESRLFGHAGGAQAQRQGAFLQANSGTLFLEAIHEMPLELQAKLYRALKGKRIRAVQGDQAVPYEARIIMASDRNLALEVEEGRFREDLFSCINAVRIDVPPLRARGSDVYFLSQYFLRQFSTKVSKKMGGISAPVAEKLSEYDWPGNVRELVDCIERAVTSARFDELTVDDLPAKIRDYKVGAGPIAGAGG